MCIYTYVVQSRSVSTAVQTDHQNRYEHDGTQQIQSDQNLCTYAAMYIIECKSCICTTNLLKSSTYVTFYMFYIRTYLCVHA